MSARPQIGETAPPFELLDQHESTVASSDLLGKPVVLFFYPKASTPG